MNGGYLLRSHQKAELRILASGLTLNFAIKAKDMLAKYDVNIDIWSITSFNELYRGGIKAERERRLKQAKTKSYVENCFEKEMPTIAVSEYQRNYSNQIREWIKGKFVVLGTDGYGRSDTREKLRDFFEISTEHLVINALMLVGKTKDAKDFMEKNNIVTDLEAPWER